MVEVLSRDAATLLPIIDHWVAPGSIIWTDRWAAYGQLRNRPGMAYVHGTVNHTLHFVDPGVHVVPALRRLRILSPVATDCSPLSSVAMDIVCREMNMALLL